MQKYILSLLFCLSSVGLVKTNSTSTAETVKVHLTCTVIIENVQERSADNVNNLLDGLIFELVNFRRYIQSHSISTGNRLKKLDNGSVYYFFDAVLDVHLPTEEQISFDETFYWLDLTIGTKLGAHLYRNGITARITEFKCELVK